MSTDINARTVGPNAAKNALRKAFKNRRPVFCWGSPGLGKSEIVAQLGKEFNAPVIDIRLSLWEPSDLKGIAYFDSNANVMRWAPPMELPDAEFAAKHPHVILFLDELNSANPQVQSAAYQLILNRRIGTYHLPENVVVVAAGNKETDRGVTFRMPAPLANRFIHLEVAVDWDDWFEWATTNKIHKDVVGFLTFSKKDLYDFDPKSSSRSFATPRSWTFVSELLEDHTDCSVDTLTNLISGSVGEGLALKFMAHRKIASKMPNPMDVLNGKVKKMESKEISAMYSLAVSLCYELQSAHKKKDKKWNDYVNNFFRFVMDCFETELVILSVKLALSQFKLPFDPDNIDSFDEFHKKYSKYINASV